MPDSSVAIEFVQYKSIFSDKNENNYISAIVLKKNDLYPKWISLCCDTPFTTPLKPFCSRQTR